MGDFKRLRVWRKAHALALHVYRIAVGIRGAHHSGLRSQVIRSALSISTNIVEGHGYASKRDFARFLGVSINSSNELEYHVLVASDLGLLQRADYLSVMTQLVEVRKMLYGLRATLQGPDDPRKKGPSPSGAG